MNRCRQRIRKLQLGWKTPLLLAGLALAMAACDEKPGGPLLPPPKPVTKAKAGHVMTAQLDLRARPSHPAPGAM